jgi:hypothetical protein
MAKYIIIYSSSEDPLAMMNNATPEQMQASMAEWTRWRNEAVQEFSVEFGMPFHAIAKLDSDGVTDSDSHNSGYSILEGDKDKIIEKLRSHPQLKRPGATIDVFEFLAMPGLEDS